MIIDRNEPVEIDKARVPKKDSGQTVDLTKSKLFRRDKVIDFDFGFLGGPQKRTGFRLSIWMWFAAMIDTLVIMSLSCFFMLGLALMAKHGVHAIFGYMTSRENFVTTFAMLFIFSGWMYFITTRTLAGASLGEWSCSLRVGQPQERIERSYLARIIIRTSLTLLTGIVILPLLSLLFKKDIAGRLTGLNIYSLK